MIQLGKKKAQDFMAELYLKHERLMYYIAGNYTKDLFRREDIVQAALIALMRNEATLHSLSDSALPELHSFRSSKYCNQCS